MKTKEGATKLLKCLNPSKALGPDELHPRVLKEFVSELGPVCAHRFQQSIYSCKIPKERSLANICIMFKQANKSLACNNLLSPSFLDLCTPVDFWNIWCIQICLRGTDSYKPFGFFLYPTVFILYAILRLF